MNKLQRNQLKQKHYIKRLKMVQSEILLPDPLTGRGIQVASWTQLQNHKATRCYKNTSTPCSCPMCKGKRYDRKAEQRQFNKENRFDCPSNSVTLDYNEDRCAYCKGCEMLANKILENHT